MEKGYQPLFLNWQEAFQTGTEAAGGKGWNLGRLQRYGFKIPRGGVLAAEAYQSYIKENSLLQDIQELGRNITTDNIEGQETEQNLLRLREKIEGGVIPTHIEDELVANLKNIGILGQPLAVRSSATAEDSSKASFAGVHESYLNVRGKENMLAALKNCYASLWTPRAVAYRRKMKISDSEAGQAVVIMEMVEAEAAGVGFTCDPRTGRDNITIINANFGLGESVVSGAVEPDEYSLDFWNEIMDKKIGRKEGMTVARKDGGTEFVDTAGSKEKQVLSDYKIRQLGWLIQRIFDALGCGEHHQDIEWAFDGQNFIILQARPVTALPRYTFAELKNQPDIWTNANLSDTMPMVQSTLNWDIYKRYFDFAGWFRDLVPPGLQGIRLYQGRAYVNLSVQQWYMYDVLGFTPCQTNEAWGGYQPELEVPGQKPYSGIKGLKRIGRLLKLISQGIQARKKAPAAFAKVDKFNDGLLQEYLCICTDQSLIQKLDEIRENHNEYYPVFMACLAASDMSRFIKNLEKHFPGQGKIYANALMAGGGNITSAQQGYRLVNMAEIARQDAAARNYLSSEPLDPWRWETDLPEESPFKHSLRSFLAEYGHRAVYELEIINPRWREDPTYLLEVVRSTMATADLDRIRTRQKQKADGTWREIMQKVSSRKQATISRLLQQALKGMELREMSKSVLVKLGGTYRIVFQEVGRRFAARGVLAEANDIYHCSWAEILSVLDGSWDGQGLKVLVQERKTRQQVLATVTPPDFIIDEVPQFTEAKLPVSGQVITGLGVAAGKAEGKARLIYHPHEGQKLQNGEVLVAPTTDPGWTPLFLRASAIVVETGGAGSHGAIVAREFGIPAVVNARKALQIIKDGQTITVDGDAGKVFLQ